MKNVKTKEKGKALINITRQAHKYNIVENLYTRSTESRI